MEKRGKKHWRRRWEAWNKRRRQAAAVRAEKIRMHGIVRYCRQAVSKAWRQWVTRLRTSGHARMQVKLALFGLILGFGVVIWQAGLLPAGNTYRLFARSENVSEKNHSPQGGSLLGPAINRLAAYGVEHFGSLYNVADFNAVSAASGQQEQEDDGTKLAAAFANLPAVVDFSEMVWPITGDVLRGFGWYRDPITQEWQFHSGLLMRPGRDYAPVRASLAGVVEAIHITGDGYQVEIRHSEGWSSTYSGLHDVSVKTGSVVAAGDVIGEFGTIDSQTTLWFGLYRDGEAVDPQDYLYTPAS